MKKLSIILQRVFPIFFFLLAATSLVIMAIGINDIYQADKQIKDGYSDVEARLYAALDPDFINDSSSNIDSNNTDSNTDNPSIIDHSTVDPNIITTIGNENQSSYEEINVTQEKENQYLDDTLLTFKLKSDYKTAVFSGVTISNLKKGSARLETSAKPGKLGNCIIYGHRDSSFKAIKHLVKGDIIEILTLNGLTSYTVEKIYVTDPYDDKIFQTSNQKMLTLITCYPFVLSGPAEERCIVVAYAD